MQRELETLEMPSARITASAIAGHVWLNAEESFRKGQLSFKPAVENGES